MSKASHVMEKVGAHPYVVSRKDVSLRLAISHGQD